MKITKRFFSVFLAAVLAFTGLVSLGMTANAAYKTGDIIQYGTYPQTLIKDQTTINGLNGVEKVWKSYGYYTGYSEDNLFDGRMAARDSWKYADFFYGTDKYRAVTFTVYRPTSTEIFTIGDGASNSWIDDMGFRTNQIYYFKYEPISWKVLDPNTGLVLCESIIDAQPVQNVLYKHTSGGGDPMLKIYTSLDRTAYGSDYALTTIHNWLQTDFMDTAFTASQKSNIKTTTVTAPKGGLFTPTPSNDKVFLPSRTEITTGSYGFSTKTGSDSARERRSSSYAAIQGGIDKWYLRSIYEPEVYTAAGIECVTKTGQLDGDFANVVGGICPAMCLASIKTDASITMPTFTVTFDANGGSVSTLSKTVTLGSTYGTLPTPTNTDPKKQFAY